MIVPEADTRPTPGASKLSPDRTWPSLTDHASGPGVLCATLLPMADGGDRKFGPDGVKEVLREDVPGANAVLFAGPDGTPWLRMPLIEDDANQEPGTVLPLRGQSDWDRPPRTSAFAGDLVGRIGDRAFWHLDVVID